jgi:hypothetical protein
MTTGDERDFAARGQAAQKAVDALRAGRVASPFEEGRAAFFRSVPLEANPYPRGQCEIEWRHGWMAGQEIDKAIESHHEL